MANSILFISLFILFPFVVDSLYFNITSFQPDDPSQNIVYHGDAAADEDGTVNFNSAARTSQVGWITYSKEVPIWSRRTGNASDFNTSFSFKIDARNLSEDSHGICFFLAPVGAPLPAYTPSGFLGLFGPNIDYKSSFDLVHIEFDTFSNPGWDPRDVASHVGINNNSLESSNYTSWNASLHSQDIGHARVSYDSVNKNLSVSWGYELTASDDESSSLSYIIDLAKVLPSEVMLGFIAAAGLNTGEHRLLSWELSSSLDPEKADNKTGLVIGIAVAVFVLVTVLVISTVVVWSRKRNSREITNMVSSSSINEDLEKETGGPRKFSYKDLVSATNGFSHQRKLGEGGFGAVYSGNLKQINKMVAVKKLSCGSRQGKKEFLNEVKVISKLRHRNLVQLIGWCNEENEFLLIYELMPNGGLNSHLFGKREGTLSWDTRYKIALGLASAILYLHEEWDQCVLHRDIKASNIMLDGDFNVKLGDFGLARVMSHKLDSHKTGLAGTFGYMAPEYVMTGCASKESDMYSFGIVLLEIVSGRKSLERRKEDEEEEGNSDDDDSESDEKSLVEKVWELYGKKELLSLGVDEKLGDDFNIEEAECLLVLGLWCGHPDKSSRPSIKQAIQVMKLESPLPANLPLKRPVATYYNSASSSSPPSVNSSRASITFSSKEFGR
ncbi:L-type lectin-domain containing receptor kinase IX.2 [Brassica rapa]|uniref:Protein kinase domain-containing protein n=1 Tax=Brassica campestris TaxID=3711 RepID=M4E6J6_BRACM|nr:L-type lectin-domain containing receptor kinase IX.2 [Brassica rapa]XP_013643229.2 L-type lectin-domain containing receptor kinase IX.2-like [Brassica napus]